MTIDATNKEIFEDGWPEGWSVAEVQVSRGFELQLRFDPGKSGAQPLERFVWSCAERTPVTEGELIRMKCVWEGVARFLNAGGDMADFADAVQLCGIDLPRLDPEGFYLLNTLQEVPEPQHIFISHDGGEVIVWDEGASVELTSNGEFASRIEAEIAEELYDDDEFGDGTP